MTTARKIKPAKPAAYVELELKNGIERFHCPVCGEAVLTPDEGFADSPCEHVVLIHDSIGEFHPRDKNIAKLIDRAEAEAEKNDGYAIELLRKSFGQNVVFFELFEPQQGSKPAEATTVVIDMAMLGPAEE